MGMDLAVRGVSAFQEGTMVDILSSLRTMWSPTLQGGQPLQDSPRSAVLGFPLRLRRQRSKADLAQMIESEIIPRLMLAHRPSAEPHSPTEGAVGPRTLDVFARMTVSSEAHTLTAYIETLVQGGLSLETVYIDLLIPTARRLGDEWNEDEISFTDVTIGLSRLQQVVRNLARRFPTREAEPGALSACFVPAPGEQHTFGLCMLEDGFRRAGWRTWLDTAASGGDAAAAVAFDWFDVFGIGATSDVPLEEIAATIAHVKAASRNKGLFVMVGGRVFEQDPSLATAVGADAAAFTAADALCIASGAVKARALA